MKTISGLIVLAVAAAAAPRAARLDAPFARGTANITQQPSPPIKVPGPNGPHIDIAEGNPLGYYANWDGAGLASPPAGKNFTGATGSLLFHLHRHHPAHLLAITTLQHGSVSTASPTMTPFFKLAAYSLRTPTLIRPGLSAGMNGILLG